MASTAADGAIGLKGNNGKTTYSTCYWKQEVESRGE
jgi:hypothetical protein